MLPLLFILVVITLSISVALQISEEISWFTYYTGGMIGVLISSLVLEFWNKRKRKKEESR